MLSHLVDFWSCSSASRSQKKQCLMKMKVVSDSVTFFTEVWLHLHQLSVCCKSVPEKNNVYFPVNALAKYACENQKFFLPL